MVSKIFLFLQEEPLGDVVSFFKDFRISAKGIHRGVVAFSRNFVFQQKESLGVGSILQRNLAYLQESSLGVGVAFFN